MVIKTTGKYGKCLIVFVQCFSSLLISQSAFTTQVSIHMIHTLMVRWLLYKEPTCSSETHTHIHTPMKQPLGAIFWFCILLKDTSTCRQVELRSNHRPSDWQMTFSTFWATEPFVFEALFCTHPLRNDENLHMRCACSSVVILETGLGLETSFWRSRSHLRIKCILTRSQSCSNAANKGSLL